MNFDQEYQETFLFQEDDMGICSECKGKKIFIRERNYWRYIHARKGCLHKWRNASHNSVEEFSEGIIKEVKADGTTTDGIPSKTKVLGILPNEL